MLRGDLPPATVRVFLIRRKPNEEIGDALMAVDYNGNNTFDDGDAFVKLVGVELGTEILSSDVLQYT